jgi:hypothetical protein
MMRSLRPEDKGYFQERADQEIRRAQLADHPAAVQAHYQLAGYYLDLVHNAADAAFGAGKARRG